MSGNVIDIRGGNGGQPAGQHGICPFISSSHVIPVADPSGLRQGPIGIQSVQSMAPCVAEKCQLWSNTLKMCSLKAISIELASNTKQVTEKLDEHGHWHENLRALDPFSVALKRIADGIALLVEKRK